MAGLLIGPGPSGASPVVPGQNPKARSPYAPDPSVDGVLQGTPQTTGDDGLGDINHTLEMGPPMAGLVGAAPGAGGAPVGTSASHTNPTPEGAGPMPTGAMDPSAQDMFSGPSALRQGIGQRNPPNLMPALTGLRSIY